MSSSGGPVGSGGAVLQGSSLQPLEPPESGHLQLVSQSPASGLLRPTWAWGCEFPVRLRDGHASGPQIGDEGPLGLQVPSGRIQSSRWPLGRCYPHVGDGAQGPRPDLGQGGRMRARWCQTLAHLCLLASPHRLQDRTPIGCVRGLPDQCESVVCPRVASAHTEDCSIPGHCPRAHHMASRMPLHWPAAPGLGLQTQQESAGGG